MPLSQVREFVGIDGGPTPRDAVLLKSLLVVHEGIAWAAGRPHYRCLDMQYHRHLGCFVLRHTACWISSAQSGSCTLSVHLEALMLHPRVLPP